MTDASNSEDPAKPGRDVGLYRAVKQEELLSIQSHGRFTNIVGLEVKYFTVTEADARRFAAMMQLRFNDGPYFIVKTSIAATLLDAASWVTVDRGIKAVTVRTALLYALAPPELLGSA